jgi:hypothetical protein
LFFCSHCGNPRRWGLDEVPRIRRSKGTMPEVAA